MPDQRTEQRPQPEAGGAVKTFAGVTPILAEAEAEALPSCRRCGHPLTADESVRRLLGPVCASRVEGVRHVALVD